MTCGRGTGDYHQEMINMNNDRYVKVIANRYIPTVESRFPGKCTVTLMDQAPYHTARTGFPSENSRKKDLLKWLLDKKVQKLSIWRYIPSRKTQKNEGAPPEYVEFELAPIYSMEKIPPAPKTPSVDELFMACYEWCMKYNQDLLKLDVDVMMNAKNHWNIMNVPNCPEYVASELFNNHVKLNVRERYTHKRGMVQLHNDILDGMYGCVGPNGYTHNPFDATMSRKFMDHCFKRMEKDGNELGLNGKLIDFWTPDCGVDVFKEKIHCPFSDKHMADIRKKFSIITEYL